MWKLQCDANWWGFVLYDLGAFNMHLCCQILDGYHAKKKKEGRDWVKPKKAIEIQYENRIES